MPFLRVSKNASFEISIAPSISVWSFKYCESSSIKSFARKMSIRWWNAILEALDSVENMDSPKNIPPRWTPYKPPTRVFFLCMNAGMHSNQKKRWETSCFREKEKITFTDRINSWTKYPYNPVKKIEIHQRKITGFRRPGCLSCCLQAFYCFQPWWKIPHL